jgi:hypothetical protein
MHPHEALSAPSAQSIDAAPDITWRQRIMRRVAAPLATLAVTAGIITFELDEPAQADQLYTVEHTEIGVYARHSPHQNDTDRIPGQGAYDGDKVKLICGVTNGDPVGPYNNHTWHKVQDLTRSALGNIWINDHWLNTAVKANELVPGETVCEEGGDNGSSNLGGQELQPATPVSPFVSYDRGATERWALAHATDVPPDAGSCTWFVSQAMAAGGFPQTVAWNLGFQGVKRYSLRYGTDATRITPDFMTYMQTLPYVEVESLGHMSAGNNDIPDVKPGDVVIYDWQDDGVADHADVVTGLSADDPEYPLVSGWSENGPAAVNYKQRGWTWSEEKHAFLQLEKDKYGNQPNKNMVAFLVHIKDEEEANIN